MGFQTHHHLVRPKVGDLRCRVPCRAAGQLVTLQRNDVNPTFLREVVEGRSAGDAAADHKATSLDVHGGLRLCVTTGMKETPERPIQ